MLDFNTYTNQEALNTALAETIAKQINLAIEQRGRAAIALSGGRTPVGMLSKLRDLPVTWADVTITLVDDRWVDEDHIDSNTHLIKSTLLQGAAQAAQFLPLKTIATTPHDGQKACEAVLSSLPEQLDVSVLGMGNDGHTASLFPFAPELESAMQSLQRCAAISPQTAPHLRMTLTAPYLAHSRLLILHITGEDKKTLIETLFDSKTLPHAPIRRVLDLNTHKKIFWAP